MAAAVWARDENPTDTFLHLIQNPFKSSFQVNAFWASLATSVIISIILALLFSVFRPHHNAIYAPRVKHADQKHAPPPVGKGLFAWIPPIMTTKEETLVDRIGLDAVVFLRCARMLRNMFIVLSIIGCGVLIPVNLTQSTSGEDGDTTFARMTPLKIKPNAVWSQIVCAWAFDVIVMIFIWYNYRAVLALRRRHFQSPEYQMSLHARTLMITDVPPNLRSEEGLMQVTDGVNPTSALPRTTIGRNVKELPSMIKKHEEAVRDLESVLSKYLKNPDRLPVNRPTMRPPRKHKDNGLGASKVDAIDYLTDRIQELETRIKDVRQTVDKRNPMPYGFASWEAIEHAHAVAYTARKKKPQGTTIQLAPRPHDIIWENVPLTPATRRWRHTVNAFWVTLLTVLWIAPNAMIAIFLSDLSNLGLVWPAFQTSLNEDPKVWAAVQGIASPALTSLIYLILPIIFRRLMRRAGDTTKTARERHVIRYLYFFFVFNNLVVFSLFSAGWGYVSAVIDAKNNHEDAWDAVVEGNFWSKAMSAMCQVSPFWVTWLLQRNLGATLDLAQLVNVAWKWFMKTFMAPTPRQSIEWTAPPPFDYASYYTYFLFYATIALCFATLQPIVLPVAALYFAFDSWMKKYLLMYVFLTKTESSGRFWSVVVNRMIFAAILSNFVIALLAKSQNTWTMIYCLVPLPFVMLGFKWYCRRTFDDDMIFYNRATLNDAEALAPGGPGAGKGIKRAGDRLKSRFGHPALYRPLLTPMVHKRAAELLKSIYRGRLSQYDTNVDFSDIAMHAMSSSTPGKTMEGQTKAPFEVVDENQLDFSYYKDRADFRDEFGSGLYGRPEDLISERSQTPRTFMGDSPDSSRASSPSSMMPRKLEGSYEPIAMMGNNRSQEALVENLTHPAFRPPVSRNSSGPDGVPLYRNESNESQSRLLHHPQPMSGANGSQTDFHTVDRWQSGGYGPVTQDDDSAPTSYDYFRGRR